MTFPPPRPSAPAGRNVLGIVAICLVALLALMQGVNRFLPAIAYRLNLSAVTISAVTGIGTLVLVLAAAVCAILGLRHPRKALAAVALGFCVISLIEFALWSGVLPAILPLLTR